MSYEIIARDSNGKDKGFVVGYEIFDCVCSTDVEDPSNNTWSLDLPTTIWNSMPIYEGDYIYTQLNGDDTEYGGQVEYIQSDTVQSLVRLQGSTWRGWLRRKVVELPAGQTHLNVSGEANAILRQLIGSRFDGMLTATMEASGFNVSGSSRYRILAEFINRLLGNQLATYKTVYNSATNQVIISAQKYRNRSEEIELIAGYGVGLNAIRDDWDTYNHVIALGGGQGLDRMIKQLWMLPDGTITQNPNHPQRPTGRNERTYKYDYGNVEDEAALIEGAEDILREHSKRLSIKVDLIHSDVELEIGDLITVSENVTEITSTFLTTKKIIRLSHALEHASVTYELEELNNGS